MGFRTQTALSLGLGCFGALLLALYRNNSISWLIATLVSLALILFFLYRRAPEDIPKLFYVPDDPMPKFIIQNVTGLTTPFCPPVWASNAHVQTILPVALNRILGLLRLSVSFSRELLSLPDGGCVALDWITSGADDPVSGRPVLLVLPGLIADVKDMAGVCDIATRRGFRCVVFNKRGHGGSPLRTPKLQSFGDPADMRCAVLHVKGRFPEDPIVAVGSSAGSGLLVSYLGEYGNESEIAASVCISPGYDALALFRRPMRWPYGPALLAGLKLLLRSHSRTLQTALHLPEALAARDIAEFDKHVYCRLYDIPDVQEYWRLNNPMRAVSRIQGPCLAISSLDDPICVKENIPFDMFSTQGNFILVCTQRGGHCGFMDRLSRTSWADQLAVDFLEFALKYCQQEHLHWKHTTLQLRDYGKRYALCLGTLYSISKWTYSGPDSVQLFHVYIALHWSMCMFTPST